MRHVLDIERCAALIDYLEQTRLAMTTNCPYTRMAYFSIIEPVYSHSQFQLRTTKQACAKFLSHVCCSAARTMDLSG